MKHQICVNLDQLTSKETEYLNRLKNSGRCELVVPIVLWVKYLKEYAPVEKYFNAYELENPPYLILSDCVDYVIVDKDWFKQIMNTRFKSLHYDVTRLTKDQGDVYFLVTLGPRKPDPIGDIWTHSHKQNGCFRGNG
jgi:hypothetical protein